MKGRKRSQQKSPGGSRRKGPGQTPARGRLAPIIEELGRVKNRLEADASYLSTRPLSLQERAQFEIESELLRKEQDVRVDFDAAFRQHPQVLVEMVSALRRYGDAEVIRNLVFAAETIYGDKLRELPGGIEFWEDLKREVAPLPHPPALTPADLRLQRLQAIEIFREAIVSYDMMSDSSPKAAARPSPDSPGPAAQSMPTPDSPHPAAQPMPSPDSPEPAAQSLPSPDSPGPDPSIAAAPAPAETAAGPQEPATGPPAPEPATAAYSAPPGPVAPVEPSGASGAGPSPDERSERLDRAIQRMKQQEEALKRDCDALESRERNLLAIENRLEEKERQLRSSEEEAGKLQAGHEEELGRLRKREAELAAELEQARDLHRRTSVDLERALGVAAERAAFAETLREREEALSRASGQVEEERAGLQRLRDALRAEEDRLRELGRELDRKSALHAAAVAASSEAPAASSPQVPAASSQQLGAASPPQVPAASPPQALPVPDAETTEASPAAAPPPAPPSPSGENILSRLASLAAPEPATIPAMEGPASPPEAPATEGDAQERRVLYKVRCPGCKNIIPVYTRERPLSIRCDACGKEGVLK